MKRSVIIVNIWKPLHLECCSTPRPASDNAMRINLNLKVFLSIIERLLCKMGTPHKLEILFKVVGYSFTNVSPTRLLIVIVLNSCLLN